MIVKPIVGVGLKAGVPTFALLNSGQFLTGQQPRKDIRVVQLIGITSGGVPTPLKLASDGSLVS